MTHSDKELSGTQADTLKRVEEGCLAQLRLEGKITIEGVMTHAKMGSRNTVQKYLDDARGTILSQLRYLTQVADDQNVPIEAMAELRRWSVDKAERALGDQQRQIDTEREAFEQRKQTALQEQQALRDQINTHKNQADRWLEKHRLEEQAHESSKEAFKGQINELQTELTQVTSELEAERGRRTAQAAHGAELKTEISTLKAQLTEADQVREERNTQQGVITDLTREVDLATQTTKALRERLREQEHSHQSRESTWLSDRETLVVAMREAQSERDRALATKTALEGRYTTLDAASHQATDNHRQSISTYAGQVATLTAQIGGKQDTVERLEKQIDRTEAKLDAMSKENRDLNRQNSALNQHVQAISRKQP